MKKSEREALAQQSRCPKALNAWIASGGDPSKEDQAMAAYRFRIESMGGQVLPMRRAV